VNFDITDADETQIVTIPGKMAEVVGMWKDMLATCKECDNQPTVRLDESTEQFNLLVEWLFRSPDFQVTKENLPGLLALADKYEIGALKRELELKLLARAMGPINGFEEFVIALSQGFTSLAARNRQYVLENFNGFIDGGHLTRLYRTCSDQTALAKLFKDALVEARRPETVMLVSSVKQYQDKLRVLETRVADKDRIIRSCEVCIMKGITIFEDNALPIGYVRTDQFNSFKETSKLVEMHQHDEEKAGYQSYY